MNKLIRDSPVRPGVAQFGSALEWGSRGREFDSRHSDQTVGCASAKERQIRQGLAFFVYIFLGAVLCSSNGHHLSYRQYYAQKRLIGREKRPESDKIAYNSTNTVHFLRNSSVAVENRNLYVTILCANRGWSASPIKFRRSLNYVRKNS